jgi:glycosyltransferase involved in cell wall biosynthesis
MRIGISTSVIQGGRSGVGRHVLALLREFRDAPPDFDFVLFGLEGDLPLFDFVRDRMEIVTVPERFRSAVKNIAWHQSVLPRLARSHRLDVLHVPSYRRLLWRRPCHLVGTIHDLAPFHLAGKYDWKRMLYGRIVVRRLAHRQDRIITVSENTARDVVRFFKVSREKITIIHNGVDHAQFHPEGGDASREFCARRFHLQKPFFLYVARLEHPGKNHVRLIQAFDQFKKRHNSEWQLAFGGADWHGAEDIHQAAAQSSIASDIRFLGFVSDSDLPHLYRAASGFVYPSLFEGFGIPPIEAMACGCPVICSTRGALGEVVGDAALIVDPEDVGSISARLGLLATEEGEWRRLQSAGFGRARRFTWALAARATLDVYSRACACTSKVSEPVFQS